MPEWPSIMIAGMGQQSEKKRQVETNGAIAKLELCRCCYQAARKANILKVRPYGKKEEPSEGARQA